MTSSSSTLTKIIGLVPLFVGVGLAYWGHQLSGSLAAKVSQKLTGALPDPVMYRYVGGAASIVAGLFLLGKKQPL